MEHLAEKWSILLVEDFTQCDAEDIYHHLRYCLQDYAKLKDEDDVDDIIKDHVYNICDILLNDQPIYFSDEQKKLFYHVNNVVKKAINELD